MESKATKHGVKTQTYQRQVGLDDTNSHINTGAYAANKNSDVASGADTTLITNGDAAGKVVAGTKSVANKYKTSVRSGAHGSGFAENGGLYGAAKTDTRASSGSKHSYGGVGTEFAADYGGAVQADVSGGSKATRGGVKSHADGYQAGIGNTFVDSHVVKGSVVRRPHGSSKLADVVKANQRTNTGYYTH